MQGKLYQAGSRSSQGPSDLRILRAKAENAQKDFDFVSTHWGYEKSHRDYIEKIAEATRMKKEEGPKPKYEEAAAGRLAPYLSRFGVTEAGLRDFMPLFYAALADLIFIFGSNLTMRRINRAFVEAFGPGWWKRKEPDEVASVPAIIPPLSAEVATVATIQNGRQQLRRPTPKLLRRSPQRSPKPSHLPPMKPSQSPRW